MCRSPRDIVANERGATMVFVAVALIGLLGVFALAIDTGMIFVGKAQVQRAADAGALAGASALLAGGSAANLQTWASDSATKYARQNTVDGTTIAPANVQTELLDANRRVRVTVNAPAVPLTFARLLGVNSASLSMRAEAVHLPSGSGKCVKPFAIEPPNPTLVFPQDEGRRIFIWKKGASEFRLIGDILGNNSGAVLRSTAASPDCKGGAIASVNQGIAAELSGEKVGPVIQGIEQMVDLDPNLTYNEITKEFRRNGVLAPDWRQSPRVANVVIYNPATSTNNVVRVADVISIFFLRPVGNGSNAIAEGHVFPSVGIKDNCAATSSCSPSILYLRLVR